ncbi:MAG: hypothetical protein V2B19_30995 [Pseudomonadota bacterium]
MAERASVETITPIKELMRNMKNNIESAEEGVSISLSHTCTGTTGKQKPSFPVTGIEGFLISGYQAGTVATISMLSGKWFSHDRGSYAF